MTLDKISFMLAAINLGIAFSSANILAICGWIVAMIYIYKLLQRSK